MWGGWKDFKFKQRRQKQSFLFSTGEWQKKFSLFFFFFFASRTSTSTFWFSVGWSKDVNREGEGLKKFFRIFFPTQHLSLSPPAFSSSFYPTFDRIVVQSIFDLSKVGGFQRKLYVRKGGLFENKIRDLVRTKKG